MKVPKPAKKPKKGKPTQRTVRSITMASTTRKRGEGEPKHVNVHEAGAGNPPILTCADLEQAA